jgi:hypothetical protein
MPEQSPLSSSMPPPPMSASMSMGAPLTQTTSAPAVVNPSPVVKKSRVNTPWTPAEEHRLKVMRDNGDSWAVIAKVRMLSMMTNDCQANLVKVVPEQNRRKCQEALVQSEQYSSS